MEKPVSPDTVERYQLALENVKSLTNTQFGTLVKGGEFTKKHRVDTAFFIAMVEFDLITKLATQKGGILYKWKSEDVVIDSELALKVYSYCRKHSSTSKQVRKEEVAKDITPAKAKAKTTKASAPAVAVPIKEKVVAIAAPQFTPAHLRVLQGINFEVPTAVKIDDAITISGVERVEFLVSTGKVLIKALVRAKEQQSEDKVIGVLTYDDKNFILDNPTTAKKNEYQIQTVECQ